MEGTKTSLWAMQLKVKREAELKERIAAFAVFTKNAEKAKKLSGNLQVRKSGCSKEIGRPSPKAHVFLRATFGLCSGADESEGCLISLRDLQYIVQMAQ